MIIDTHCHLDTIVLMKEKAVLVEENFSAIEKIIERGRVAGVEKIVNIGCDVESSYNSLILSERFDNVFATIGLHPTDCNMDWKYNFEKLKKLIKEHPNAKLVGVGEIGLDYHHVPNNPEKQKDAFIAQLELALAHHLPLSIHTRHPQAAEDAMNILEKYRKDDLRGTLHCFQQSLDIARQAVGLGLVLGVDGPVDYPKNIQLRETFKTIGLESLVLETDAPFLPPQFFRGKPNEPAFLTHVVAALAQLFVVDKSVVEKVTSENAEKLFKI